MDLEKLSKKEGAKHKLIKNNLTSNKNMKNLFEINPNENTEIEVLDVKECGTPSINLCFEFTIKRDLCFTKCRGWGNFSKMKTYPHNDREGEYVGFEDPDYDVIETRIGNVIVDSPHKLVQQLNEMGLSSLANFIDVNNNIVWDTMKKIARDMPIVKMNFGYMPIYNELPLKPIEENNNN
jgi:hypothetical protein